MIAASNSNHADLPQTPRSLSKSHDDGDVKYFFQRPEQDLNVRSSNSKWSGDDTVLEQVYTHKHIYIIIIIITIFIIILIM